MSFIVLLKTKNCENDVKTRPGNTIAISLPYPVAFFHAAVPNQPNYRFIYLITTT